MENILYYIWTTGGYYCDILRIAYYTACFAATCFECSSEEQAQHCALKCSARTSSKGKLDKKSQH